MSFNPPLQQINTYNPTYWAFANPSFLSLQQAYLTFLPLKGGTLTGSLYAPQLFLSGDITSTAGITLTNVASQISLANNTASTSSSTGALIIPNGGIYVGNNSIFNSSINMTASNSILTLSGINSQINISNNFSASISSSTGALLCSGGAYFGNNSIISGTLSGISTLTATNLTGTLTTAAQTNITSLGNLTSLTMFGDINMSGHNISNINVLTLTGTTDSTSVSTGCLTLAGGMGIAKSLFVGTGITVPNASGGNLLTLASTATGARTTIYLQTDSQNWEFGARGSTAANPNSMYIYNGGYKLLMNSTGDTSILSTTNSTSYNTGCLVLSGGLGIASNVYCNGTLNLNHNGSNIGFTNGSNSGLIELAASPNILRLVNTYAVNIGAAGVNIGNASTFAPRYPLDFNSTASDVIINLYQSGGNALYGIGANNSALELHSGSDIVGYSGTTGNGSLGTKIFTANSAGNVISQAGLHANSYSTTGLSQYNMCVHMHYASANGTGSFFTYNYNTSTYGITSIHNNNLYCTSNGFVTVNGGGASANFPLDVRGSATFTTLNSFGYLSQTGSGTASTFSNRPFSASFSSGILVTSGEIDVISDIRAKKNIVEIKEEEAERFINKCQPIEFQYKKSIDRRHYGYSAQSLLRENFPNIVGYTASDEPLEEQTIKCSNGDKIELREDVRLIISMIDIIPLLHKALLISNDKILNNNKMIHQLQTQINNLQNKQDMPRLDILNIELNQIVTESNHKQNAINNNFDQRIALIEQNRIIYESRIADLEKKMTN